MFKSKCENQCECNEGMKGITLKYVDDETAESIVFYYGQSELCVFLHVIPGQVITCSVEFSSYDKLRSETGYSIFYANGECHGSFDTSCSRNIYNQYGYGCNKLRIIGWQDMNGFFCDGRIFTHDGDENSKNTDNASINHHVVGMNNLNVDKDDGGLNTTLRIEFSVIICALIGLLFIAFYCLVHNNHKPLDINSMINNQREEERANNMVYSRMFHRNQRDLKNRNKLNIVEEFEQSIENERANIL